LNAPAQAQGDASLWGSVSDSSGAAIADASVTIRNLETGTVRAVVTDEAGRFNAPALSVGHYEVAASKQAFKSIGELALASPSGREKKST